MNYDCSAFDATKLSFDVKEYKWMTFPNHHRLFDLLLGYIASHLIDDCGNGYRADVTRSNKVSEEDDEEENLIGSTQYGRILVKISFGEYKFKTLDGTETYALYQHIGKPVGGDCGADVMQNLIIFTKSIEKFSLFLSELINLSEKPEEGKFVCFTWLIRHQYWREDVRVNARPIESVVLPAATKQRLLKDAEKFLSARTKDFYHRNGIPYRRSYLFHGVPGTGKTSMVQALAGHFKRNVCFLMPTHPEMTDDNLREAIQSIPENSVVVFEDIDALFDKSRRNKVSKSALTFSGLLNALDGIGSPNGQIFVLTTNLRENLDHALIRNGRVDLHIEFNYAVEEQMEQMWKNFYPDAHHLANDFSIAVMNALKERNLQITTSTLQHFFITEMDATAEEALKDVPAIVEEILQNNSKSMLNAATKKKKDNNHKQKEEDKDDSEEEEEDNEKDNKETHSRRRNKKGKKNSSENAVSTEGEEKTQAKNVKATSKSSSSSSEVPEKKVVEETTEVKETTDHKMSEEERREARRERERKRREKRRQERDDAKAKEEGNNNKINNAPSNEGSSGKGSNGSREGFVKVNKEEIPKEKETNSNEASEPKENRRRDRKKSSSPPQTETVYVNGSFVNNNNEKHNNSNNEKKQNQKQNQNQKHASSSERKSPVTELAEKIANMQTSSHESAVGEAKGEVIEGGESAGKKRERKGYRRNRGGKKGDDENYNNNHHESSAATQE